MESMTNNDLDFSKYRNVFCDSQEALRWAYEKGLPKDAKVRTSSPTLLHNGNDNIQHVEKDWSVDKIRKFQSGMLTFSKEIFDALIDLDGVSRGMALGAAQYALRFHVFLYKTGCLNEDDLLEERLFIRVDGDGGRDGNNMNSPWDELLANNSYFKTVNYTLNDSGWVKQSVKSVSLFDRIRLAGMETVIYRIAIKLSKWFPGFLTKAEVIIINENELIIEAASHLFRRGIPIKTLEFKESNDEFFYKQPNIKKRLLPIIKRRVESWVKPSLVNVSLRHFFDQLNINLLLTKKYHLLWELKLNKTHKNTIILCNAPTNTEGNALYDVCRQKRIPFISALHGVTHELSELIEVNSPFFDIAVSDICLTHTDIAARVQQNSYFSVGQGIPVGLPTRTLRMQKYHRHFNYDAPILYASTNLYKGCHGAPYVDLYTDFDGFKREYRVASLILSKIPHKVCYKTYPEENRRFPDADPIEQYINQSTNMTLIKEKVDMRYLLSGFKVIITSAATSTLGWAIMTEKPVVFINWNRHAPLTDDAYHSLNKGLFLFDGDSEDFHERLLSFLSKPIESIYIEWKEKSQNRVKMIEKYFSKNVDNVGSIAADIIENI